MPDSPATTRSDLPRARRICRTRRPVVCASSASTEYHSIAEVISFADAPEPSPRGVNLGEEVTPRLRVVHRVDLQRAHPPDQPQIPRAGSRACARGGDASMTTPDTGSGPIGRAPLTALVWAWVLAPFLYGLYQLLIKIPALFG